MPEDLQADGGQVSGLVVDSPFLPAFVLPLQNRLAYLAHFLGGDQAKGFEWLVAPSLDIGFGAALNLIAMVLHQNKVS
jgi:hypothetical protein